MYAPNGLERGRIDGNLQGWAIELESRGTGQLKERGLFLRLAFLPSKDAKPAIMPDKSL